MSIKVYYENQKKLYEVYLNGYDSAGRRRQKRTRGIESLTKAKAVEFELKRELAILKEQRVPFRWEEWFDSCIDRMKLEYLPSTLAVYSTQIPKWVHPHWKGIEIQTIAKSDVADLIFKKCCDIASQRTRRNVLKMLKRLFQMAVEDGILDRNPCTGINVRVPEVEQKVLTTAEVEIFLTQAKIVNHRFYPIWVLALMTGMRSGELFALKWTDIDFEGRMLSVSRQWTSRNGFGPTKSRRCRMVPISSELLSFLKELKLKDSSQSEFVLPHLREWDHGEQAKATREFCIAIGITPVKFHDLRATFITNLLANGESLVRVMSIVGHSELKTTNGYLRKAGIELKGATEKLGYSLPSFNDAQILSFPKR